MRLPRLRKGQVRVTIQGVISGGRTRVFVAGREVLPGKVDAASVDVSTGSPLLKVTLFINASRFRIDR